MRAERPVNVEETGKAQHARRGLPVLPPAEREIMEILWSADGPCTLRMVRIRSAEEFPARRGRGASSVQSILETLTARGYVEKIERSQGRRIRYRPLMSRGEALAGAAETAVDDFCRFHRRDGWFLVQAFLAVARGKR